MRIIGIDLVSMGVGEGVRMGVNIMWLLVDHMLRLWCCGMVKLWLLVLLQLNESGRDGSQHGKRDECEKLRRGEEIDRSLKGRTGKGIFVLTLKAILGFLRGILLR